MQRRQFAPEFHARMNWRRSDQDIFDTASRDFFAPETVLTPDGRRVMWAWLWTVHEEIEQKSIQSLPRELSLAEDGSLIIQPLRELEDLRSDHCASIMSTFLCSNLGIVECLSNTLQI